MERPVRPLEPLFRLPQNDALTIPWVMRGFLSVEECAEVIALAAGEQPQAARTDREVKGLRDSEVRWILPGGEAEWLFERLEQALERVNERYHFRLSGFFEGVQVASYATDGHYDWHMDIGRGEYSTRKLSMTVQLSDPADYAGGELEFRASTQPAPREQGTLVVFPSFLEHRVRPVTSGSRTSLVSWISGPPFS